MIILTAEGQKTSVGKSKGCDRTSPCWWVCPQYGSSASLSLQISSAASDHHIITNGGPNHPTPTWDRRVMTNWWHKSHRRNRPSATSLTGTWPLCPENGLLIWNWLPTHTRNNFTGCKFQINIDLTTNTYRKWHHSITQWSRFYPSAGFIPWDVFSVSTCVHSKHWPHSNTFCPVRFKQAITADSPFNIDCEFVLNQFFTRQPFVSGRGRSEWHNTSW